MERPDAAEFQEAIDAVLASVKDLSAEDGTAICPHCRGGLAGLNPSAVKVIQSAAKGNQGLLTLVLGLLSQQSELATKIDSVADLLRLINAPGARAAASGEPMDLDVPSTSGRSHGPAPASEESNCALARVAHAQTKSVAWRDVDRVEFVSPQLSAAVWGAIAGPLRAGLPHRTPRGAVPDGLNAKWRVYRYKEGQGFGPHFDEEDACPATGRASCYTLLLYLNDVASGGETVFYRSRGREVAAVTPELGLVVVHAQGPDCLLHEGRPVGRGAEKWLLRSDVLAAAAPAAAEAEGG